MSTLSDILCVVVVAFLGISVGWGIYMIVEFSTSNTKEENRRIIQEAREDLIEMDVKHDQQKLKVCTQIFDLANDTNKIVYVMLWDSIEC